MFVARPLATAVATVGSGFDVREKALLGWAGLRGAVPVVLAIFPVTEGVPHAREFFNIVFFAVLLSTLLQGTTIEPVARWLGVTTDEPMRMPSVLEVGAVRELGADVVEHVIRPGDAAVGARLRDLGLPRDALVSLIVRGNEALLPRGSTRLEEGDRLLVLVRREVAEDLPALLERWRKGPVARADQAPADVHRQRPGLHRAPVVGRRRRRGASAGDLPGGPSSSTSARAATCPAHW